MKKDFCNATSVEKLVILAGLLISLSIVAADTSHAFQNRNNLANIFYLSY
jgi:hypothetical protein